MSTSRPVLIVEDDRNDAEMVAVYLRRDGRFTPTIVSTLAEADAALRSGDLFDAVVLDLSLPDSRGLQTFETLSERFPMLPIVVLSGREDEELALESVQRGAQDYVPKTNVQEDGRLIVRSLLYACERHGRLLAERNNLLMEHDIALARRVQQRILPTAMPSLPGYELAGTCQPATQCGGDLLDFILHDDGRCDLLVADVSGHGVGAAMVMVGTRRTLRTAAVTSDDLGALLKTTDDAVRQDTLDEQFVTLFYVRLDPVARTFEYAAAGHLGWVIRADGSIEVLDEGGPPLGLFPNPTYKTRGPVALSEGDLVVLMTDGVYEAMSPDKQPLRHHNVVEFLRDRRQLPPSTLVTDVINKVDTWTAPNSASDDVTLLLMKVTGESE